MNSRSLGATKVFAWPDAEVAVMGAVAAVRILHRRTLAAAPADERHELEAELAAEHEREAGGLVKAQEIGVVDEVIEPAKTRQAHRRGDRRRPARPRPARQHPAVAARSAARGGWHHMAMANERIEVQRTIEAGTRGRSSVSCAIRRATWRLTARAC